MYCELRVLIGMCSNVLEDGYILIDDKNKNQEDSSLSLISSFEFRAGHRPPVIDSTCIGLVLRATNMSRIS